MDEIWERSTLQTLHDYSDEGNSPGGRRSAEGARSVRTLLAIETTEVVMCKITPGSWWERRVLLDGDHTAGMPCYTVVPNHPFALNIPPRYDILDKPNICKLPFTDI